MYLSNGLNDQDIEHIIIIIINIIIIMIIYFRLLQVNRVNCILSHSALYMNLLITQWVL